MTLFSEKKYFGDKKMIFNFRIDDYSKHWLTIYLVLKDIEFKNWLHWIGLWLLVFGSSYLF